MNVFNNIYHTYKQGNSLTKLIYINIFVFIGLKILDILLLLFNIQGGFMLPYLAVPADLTLLLHHIWTPFTYMFLHEGFLHIFFNLISLYWFGKIFIMYFSEKQLVGLYLTGGLLGALFYIAAFNIFPYYSPTLHLSLLLGASGSIMAIIVATAIKSPNMEMQLMFIGNIKLKYIALVVVLMSFFGITSDNGGGQLAHLGGALAGYLFIVSLRQGKDLTTAMTGILNGINNVFRPRKMKVKPNKNRSNARMNDAEFNAHKARRMAQLDQILDKIKTSGYESLSAEEKKRLFEQGNKN
jgi:membrane associated rhomboid family serine protease